MASPNALESAAYRAAQQFLEIIAIVDDGELTKTLPSASAATTPSALPTEQPAATVPDISDLDSGSPIDYEEISRASIKEGVFSTLVRPEPLDENGATQIAAGLEKADVIVLDWRIKGIGDGKFTGWIIKALLDRNPDRRRQVICIYSDFPDPDEALKQLASDLGLQDADIHDHQIQTGSLVIVWRAKVKVLGLERTEAKDLPRELIKEFAKRHSGLVPLLALDSLRAVRLNTLPILERFSDEADLGFAFDCIQLGGTTKVAPSVRRALADDLAISITAAASLEVPNLEASEAWLADKLVRHEDLPNGIKQESLEGSRTRLAKMIAGNAPDSDYGAARSTRRLQQIANCFFPTDSAEQNFPRFRDLYARFSALLATQYWPHGRPCQLDLGTVLSREDNTFWISLQPSCDCLRLKTPTRFPFVPVVTSLPTNAAGWVATPIINPAGMSLFLDPKMANVEGITFAPDGTSETVLTENSHFTDTETKKWRFVANLRMSHSHRLLQMMTDQAGRIGVSEGELGRRLAKGE